MKQERIGRTPLWPSYTTGKAQERTLAVFHGNSLYIETGETLNATTFAQLVDQLFHRNLLSFVVSLTDEKVFPFLDACIEDDKTTVICNKDGIPSSIKIKRKSSSRWIIPSQIWEKKILVKKPPFTSSKRWQKRCVSRFLSGMRQTYTYIGIGTKGTPSSCGTALLQQEWYKHNYAFVSSANGMCADFLYKYRIGSRCDTLCEKGSFYPELIELDAASFFSAEYCRKIPIGTSIRCHGTTIEEIGFFTYVCRATVTIHSELALGPFPVRKQKRSKIIYPTLPGTYVTFLWKEQIEDCREVGCTVELFRYGYGWHESTEAMTSSAQRLYQLRISAPTKQVEKDVKKITVGAWGRFGMNNTFYSLTTEEKAELGERCINDDHFDPLNYYVHKEEDFTQPSMIHWYSYNIMQGTRTLYRLALPYAKEGRLVMTNYDAIIVLERDETHTYAQKYTTEALLCDMGDLRWTRLTNVTIHGPRKLECDQYVSMPGVKR